MIFRNNEIVFRKNEIIFRKNEIFEYNLRNLHIKKVEHVTLGVPYYSNIKKSYFGFDVR